MSSQLSPGPESPPEATPPSDGRAPTADAALESLLALLLESSFLLTDPHGAVTKWNAQAERLFGLPGEQAVGRSLFESLIEAAEGSPERAWREFLEGGDGMSPQARIEGRGRHSAGGEFAVELTFVPVRLSEGFEFSAFLQDLGVGVPPGVKLARMRRVHERVLTSIGAALADPGAHCEGARLAGALVAFRPLEELPWLERSLDAEPEPPAAAGVQVTVQLDETLDRLAHAEREAEEAHREAREALAEREAVHTQAADARERIEALELQAHDVRVRLEAAEAAAHETAEGVAAARAEAEAARTQSAAALARFDELEQGQAGLGAAVEELRALLQGAEERSHLAADEAGAARAAAEEASVRLEAVEGRAEDAAGRLEALETGAGDERERLEELERWGGEEREARESARREAEEMRSLLEEARRESAGASDAAAETRRDLEEARREIGQARIEEGASALTAFGVLEEAQQQADERRRQFEQLLREAHESRERLEQLAGEAKAELERAERTREEVESAQQQASEALERLDEMRREAGSTRVAAETARSEAAKAREQAAEARDLLARLHREAKEALGRAQEGRSGAQEASGEVRAARGHVADLQALAAEALGELQQARAETEQARHAAEEARARAEEACAEAEHATRTAYAALEDAGAAWDSYHRADPSRLTAVAQSGHVELPPAGQSPPPWAPERPLREGFDDAPMPMATIGLDGHFKELNARFSELVGYSESDFRQTIWPSVVDRDLLDGHRVLMEEMCAGRLDSTPWETSYVHEQGLLVHMIGRLTLQRDENGEPGGFLFAVDGDSGD